MNSARYIIPCFLFLLNGVSYSQTNYGIKKIDAYYSIRIPGNIPVDENGKILRRDPDTLHMIFVETIGEAPTWNTAWIGNSSYSLAATRIPSAHFEVGIKRSGNQKIILSTPKGHVLYQLELIKHESGILLPQKIKRGEILLRGKYKKKAFLLKMIRQTELTVPDSV